LGGDEAPVVIWSLGWCRASSETDPFFLWVGFLTPEKGKKYKWLLPKSKSRRFQDEKEDL
jgi:hypothetical protein